LILLTKIISSNAQKCVFLPKIHNNKPFLSLYAVPLEAYFLHPYYI